VALLFGLADALLVICGLAGVLFARLICSYRLPSMNSQYNRLKSEVGTSALSF
jgi:hypothetical protein